MTSPDRASCCMSLSPIWTISLHLSLYNKHIPSCPPNTIAAPHPSQSATMSTQPLLQRADGEPPFQPETPALARSNRLKLLSTLFITLLLVGGTIWIGVAGERTPDRGDADKLAEYWMRR